MQKTMEAYDPELIPVVRKPVYASYDNKKLKNWTADNFADYVFDKCASPGKFAKNEKYIFFVKESFIFDSLAEYLEEIPPHFARVYLYGVFEMLKARISMFKIQG